MAEKLTYQDFAKRIKEKYPQYNSLDDSTLTAKILEKYPQYSETVDTGFMNPVKTEETQPTNDTQVEPIKQPEQTNKGLISTPQQEFLTDEEMQKRVAFEPQLPQESQTKNIQYQQPMTDKTDYMGVFNKKEDYKAANESGVSVSTFDEIKKSAANAEYPVEFIAEANNIKKRLEALPKYFPELAAQLEPLKSQVAKLNPENITDFNQQLDELEQSAFQPSDQPQFGIPNDRYSEYFRNVKFDPTTEAIRMLANDTKKIKKIESIINNNPSDKWGAFESAIKTSNIISGAAGQGVKDYVDEYINLGQTIKGNKAVTKALEKLNTDEPLTTDDKLIIKALGDNAQLHEKIDENIPLSYKIGQGAGYSVPFMLEFALTGGGATSVGKGILKGTAKYATSKIGKFAVNSLVKIAETGVHTPMMPSLYKNTAIDVSKGEDFGKALFNNAWQTAAEVGSERIFMNYLAKGSGTVADKTLRAMGINFNVDKGAVGLIRNIGEEYAEEKVGEIMTAPKDYKNFKEFWNNFTNIENNLVTFGSVAASVGAMGSVAMAGNSVAKARNEAKLARHEKLLPSDVRAEIDVIIDNKDLTVQEQYNLVGELIGDRIDKGELTENPSEVAANAIAYLNYKTQVNSAEATDSSAKIENGEITVGEVEETDLATQQEQLDYLKKQGVEVPDGTNMDKLEKLYNETKSKQDGINGTESGNGNVGNGRIEPDGTAKTEVQERAEMLGQKPEIETAPTSKTEGKTDKEAVLEKEDWNIPKYEYVTTNEPTAKNVYELSNLFLNKIAREQVKEANEKQDKLNKDLANSKISKDEYDKGLKEIEDNYNFIKVDNVRKYLDKHKESVKNALLEGKQIYEGWQEDYPDLAKQYSTKPINTQQTETTVKSKTEEKVTEKNTDISETQQQPVVNAKTKSETVKGEKQKELPKTTVFNKVTKAIGLQGKDLVSSLGKTARNGKINGVDVVVQQGESDNEIIIESMRTPSAFRQRGKATKALQTITEQADKEGITLKLRAVPQKGSKITPEQLKSFYEKNGFEFDGIEGTRTPNKKGVQDATKIGANITSSGKQTQELERGEEERLRVRDDEQNKEAAGRKVAAINRLIDDARYYDKIPNNHTQQKAKAGNDLQKLANSIGYSIGKDAKGNTTVFDENKKPVEKKISVRETQENIQSHKLLNEYEDKNFINNVNKLISNSVYLNGVRLYGLKPSEIAQGIKNIIDGKKTVAANNLLDALEEAYKANEINFQDGSGVPFDKLIESIDNESMVEYSPFDNIPERIIDKINSGEGLNETDIRELEDAFISNEQIDELKELSDERQSEIERENRELEEGIGTQESGEKAETAVQQIVSKQSKTDEDGQKERQGQGRQVLTPTENNITGVKSGDVVAESKFITKSKTEDYFVIDDYIFDNSELKDGIEYKYNNSGSLIENKQTNRHVVKGNKYSGIGNPQNAIDLFNQLSEIEKPSQTPQTQLLLFALNELKISISEFKEKIQNGGKIKRMPEYWNAGLEEYTKEVRDYLSQITRLNKAVSDETIEKWYNETIIINLKKNTTPNGLGIFVHYKNVEDALRYFSKSKQEITPTEEKKITKATSIKPKNLKDVYKAGREIFGLNRSQALAQAIIVNTVVNKIAKNRGVTPEKVWSEIEFRKGDTKGLKQGTKGAIQFLQDGSAIISALTNPNVSTPLHEIAHLYERYMPESERKAVLKWAKHKTWTTDTSEMFARGFEKYLATGIAPTTELQKIFDRFKKWLTDIYNGIVGSEIDIELNDAMTNIYSQMLGAENVKPAKAKKVSLKELEDGLDMLFQETETVPKTIEVNGKQRPTSNSNGQQIHPTIEGIKNFWEWFSDSKVVDKEGRPLVVYHGTKEQGLQEFLLTRDIGFHFAVSKKIASDMAGKYEDEYGFTNKIEPIEVYLSVQNLAWVEDLELWKRDNLRKFAKSYNDYARDEGKELFEVDDSKTVLDNLKRLAFLAEEKTGNYKDIDGFAYINEFEGRYTKEPKKTYIVFNSNQIKSVNRNVGTFNETNPNILYQPEQDRTKQQIDYIKKMADAFKAQNPKATNKDVVDYVLGVFEKKGIKVANNVIEQSLKDYGYTPEFTEQYPIGTTNAKVRTSREMRGLDAIPKAERVANKDLWQSVVDKIANGIINPRQTVKDILNTPGVETSEIKEAVVKWDRWRILKETKYTVEEIQSKQQNNDNRGLVDLFLRKAELEAELQENDLAAEKLGAAWGKAGQFRQRNLEEDMSLAAIIREAQILNGGKKLTALQEKKFEELSKKFEALQAEYDRLKAESEKKHEQAKADEEKKRKAAEQKLINDIQNKLAAQTPKPMRDFDTQFKADIKKQKLTEKENTIKERLRDRLGRLANLQFAVGEEGGAMIIEELSGVIKDMSELGIVKLEQGIDRIIAKVKDYMMSVDKKFDGKNLDKYKDEIGKALNIKKVVDDEYERLINKLVEKSQLGFDTGIKGILNDIVYNKVVSGRGTIDDVVDDIYESVKNRISNITKRKIRDAISGYGEFRKLSKEETDVAVRELKRQGRLDSSIEDVEQNKLPLRTGVERDVQTQETRQKQARILKEIKERDLVPPPTEEDQEAQWRSGLQAYKRRLENAIADIEKEISTGERKAKTQPKKYNSPEIESLKTELERLKKVREAIDKESGVYVEQRESAIIKATERAIAELEMDIDKLRQGLATDKNVTVKGNIFGLSKPVKEKIVSDRITGLQNLKESLQRELSDLLPDAIKDKALLDKYRKQRERRLEQLKEQQRTKDYGEKPKPYRPPLDKATIEINRAIERLKYDIEKEKEQIRLDNRTWKERFGEGFLNAWSLPKALIASVDLSAPLRQGIVMISKPKTFGKAFAEMFRYAFSKNAYEDWLFDLKGTDDYYEMLENGLYIAEPTAKLAAKEEHFMSNWLRYIDKIPLYGALRAGSERAYIGFLNKLRIDIYRNFRDKLQQQGFTPEEIQKELKSYSHFVNTATGRGKLSVKLGEKEIMNLEGIAPVLNGVFFSPRLIASRLATFNPAFYANMSKETRKDAIKTYLGTTGMIMTTLALVALAYGDDERFEIELDPRSSNFLKIRFNNIYYDLWGGHQQVARTLAQVITGQTKKNGRIQKMTGDKWRGTTRWSTLTNFFMNKVSPTTGTVLGILQGGKTYDGEDMTVMNELINKTVPLYLSDIKEVVEEEGWEFAFITGIPAMFGVGVQTQNRKPKKSSGSGEENEFDYGLEGIEEIDPFGTFDNSGFEESIPDPEQYGTFPEN